MEDRLLFDWLSVTFDFSDVSEYLAYIGFTSLEFIDLYGMYGYQKRFYCDGISIHYDGTKEQGIWLDVSGQGCRTLESIEGFDWFKFLSYIVDSGFVKNFTRVDVAFDDFNGALRFNNLIPDTQPESKSYVSKFKSFEITQTSEGTTIYHGSKKSDIRFRIYDKGAQSKKDYHWTRFEIQLRDLHADSVVKNYISGVSISSIFFGVVNSYLRYIEPRSATRVERCVNAAYWDNFLQSKNKINLLSNVSEEYTTNDLNKFVLGQAGNSIRTFIEIYGSDALLSSLYDDKKILSKKQQRLIVKATSI